MKQPTQTTICAAVSPEMSPSQSAAICKADLSALRAARATETRRGILRRAYKAYPSTVWMMSSSTFLLAMHPWTGSPFDKAVLLPVLAGNVILHPAVNGCFALANRRRARVLAEVPHGYVLREELTRDAADLLTRAQDATHAVLTSAAFAQGYVDRQRYELTLPTETWQIAVALASYSSHVMATLRPDSVAHNALETRLRSITSRVTALEELAARVAAHDARIADNGPTLRPGAGEDLLDLLAGTEADALAAGVIGDLAAHLPRPLTRDAAPITG